MKNKTLSFVLVLALLMEVMFSFPRAQAAAGDIFTVAGNGSGGFSGDGGLATAAQIDAPNGVFVDSTGNLFIADYFNNRVRKVTKSTGFISTIAGTGVAGSLGDGGLATSAQVNGPTTVITDNSGNIYIGESEGDRVRKIDTLGIITTFAGTGTGGYTGDSGLATAAQLDNPADIAFDSAENLYIAQYNNNVVRKVDVATGIITTVAGNGTGGFSGDGGPATSAEMTGVIGVDVDQDGNIYIVNLNNYRIRKVDAITGFISTVVGTGTSGFSGDGGLATSAEIGDTYDVSVDSLGDFFISDRSNGRIRKVTVNTGMIDTVAGNGTGSYSGDGGPATSAGINPVGVFVDTAGNLFIGDNTSDRVRKVEGPSPIVCGNGIIQSGEQCDDSNVMSGDGCSSTCQNEGGGRRRIPEPPPETPLSQEPVIEPPHPAAELPPIPETPVLPVTPLALIQALQQLFAWMNPVDYQLTDISEAEYLRFHFILRMKQTLKALAVAAGYSDGYGLNKPEQEPMQNIAELVKVIMISFSDCYTPSQLQRAISHDRADNPGYWWAGYWHFLDPLMQRFFGPGYLLWDPIDRLRMLDVLEVFLTDFCGKADLS